MLVVKPRGGKGGIIPWNLAKSTSLPHTLESQLLNTDQHTTAGSPLSPTMINTVFIRSRVVI